MCLSSASPTNLGREAISALADTIRMLRNRGVFSVAHSTAGGRWNKRLTFFKNVLSISLNSSSSVSGRQLQTGEEYVHLVHLYQLLETTFSAYLRFRVLPSHI